MSALFSAKNREFLLGPLSKNNPVIVQVLPLLLLPSWNPPS